MATLQPCLSLGLTVQNGGHLLAAMLNSILSQSFQNFELIILDNASTDQTEAIAQRYAAKDERIRYYRQDQTQPELCNRNQILSLARGVYFKFITFEEAVIPNALEQHVELLHERSYGLLNPYDRFPLLTEAPEEPLLSKETIMYQQDPQEWLSEKINRSNET
ncbi:glycosyltransferase family 2 protein [Phormidesmis priestleyi ULC007]|uniref:Glycosyltransferase family 2 protein n=1 Tax=Phormidesmis priestleyi ULC007 TaxID=1920490 RepID=A0A2T1DFU2_9CYAN|nr:glycosyltransferase family A protein [Phormidesmis priestleyi]PSB19327.1 glycosyltransferase family 2 protein [Phormidesmis priestleyi ULC007]PZO52212.1 MAG: glycosyltransferase family 2 protein [Phormidesmis priestleyi]